ncbi:hypothetical protein VTK73DRAFT_7207 [Phialemonium thermophilum]|uniref:Aminoglycoside phosphotransferase domain-containing protein n=1 Tax=Phialemonium thermophilum TaxID=223376 RepID=A0ABR3WFW8_9PEZI
MTDTTHPPEPSLTDTSKLTESRHPLPYFAPDDQLPEPLPTEAAILQSQVVLKKERPGRRVVRVGKHYAVKYGATVSVTEGLSMLFAKDACDIHIPKVYALYTRISPSGHSIGYIVMEYMEGQTLQAVWETLSDTAKADICAKLREIFDALRSIPSPGYFGCVGRQPLEECMFWTRPDDGKVERGLLNGPFNSEDQLNNAFVLKYLYNSGIPAKAAFYRRAFPRVFHGHPAVFTHGDFQRKNVIVQDNGELVLLDWESAGWYPSYWEYCLAMFACGNWNDDWSEYVARVLDEYPTEYVWFHMMRNELWS